MTSRFLRPALPALEALFLEIRAETDTALGPNAPARYGAAYPVGYCREIALDVLGRLRARIVSPRHPGERAIKAFLDHGGTGRRVWGALRGQYFQNAFQFGGLYIDVSNDTVNIHKPKVEIMPMAESGFERIRDAAHFADIAGKYWGMRIFGNFGVPSLAPILPMVGVYPSGVVQLQSNAQWMTDLFRGADFALSEAWIAQAEPPPASILEALRAGCPDDLLAANPVVGRQASLEACRSSRAARRAGDQDWFRARMAQFDRIRCLSSLGEAA